MPQSKDPDDGVKLEHLAFEYVAGTLRGAERALFQQVLVDDNRLQIVVQFWEEQLMAKHDTTLERAPAQDAWHRIESRIESRIDSRIESRIQAASGAESQEAPPSIFSRYSQLLHRMSWSQAGFAFAFVWAVSLTLWMGFAGLTTKDLGAPNTDYVAVLTDVKEKPLLTALTSSEGTRLWLKWEKALAEEGTSIQLWAQSRRDGQVRPLFVFEAEALTEIRLDEAALRLIRDSAYLLLTREEEGGSAIDEPSDILLAKGACIRLNTPAI